MVDERHGGRMVWRWREGGGGVEVGRWWEGGMMTVAHNSFVCHLASLPLHYYRQCYEDTRWNIALLCRMLSAPYIATT